MNILGKREAPIAGNCSFSQNYETQGCAFPFGQSLDHLLPFHSRIDKLFYLRIFGTELRRTCSEPGIGVEEIKKPNEFAPEVVWINRLKTLDALLQLISEVL